MRLSEHSLLCSQQLATAMSHLQSGMDSVGGSLSQRAPVPHF